MQKSGCSVWTYMDCSIFLLFWQFVLFCSEKIKRWHEQWKRIRTSYEVKKTKKQASINFILELTLLNKLKIRRIFHILHN